jgi:uncharacterized protein YjiS (DUF1127 family)
MTQETFVSKIDRIGSITASVDCGRTFLTEIPMTRAPDGAFGATFMFAFTRQAFLAARKLIVNLRHRSQVQRLHTMDDRMLADIGLRRSDITSALDRAFNEDPSEHLVKIRCDVGFTPRIQADPGGTARVERVRAPDAC